MLDNQLTPLIIYVSQKNMMIFW